MLGRSPPIADGSTGRTGLVSTRTVPPASADLPFALSSPTAAASERGALTTSLAGESVELLAERALYWPRTRTLLVADVHLGKAAAFRAGGVPVPRGATASDLARLGALVARTGAGRLTGLRAGPARRPPDAGRHRRRPFVSAPRPHRVIPAVEPSIADRRPSCRNAATGEILHRNKGSVRLVRGLILHADCCNAQPDRLSQNCNESSTVRRLQMLWTTWWKVGGTSRDMPERPMHGTVFVVVFSTLCGA